MTVKRVTPAEAQELLKQGWTYVDVRSEGEFDAGRPAEAVNVPLMHNQSGRMSPNADFIAVVKGNFSKDAKLVIGCLSGGRSARAAAALEAEGYTSLVDQLAGWGGGQAADGKRVPGWQDAGLPVTSGPAADKAYSALSKKKG